MKAVTRFEKIKKSLSKSKFIEFCKRVNREKENYSKPFVQKAQQYL